MKLLNHFLSDDDCYDRYETLIASQANESGLKQIILVTLIDVSGISSYFNVVKKRNNIKEVTPIDTIEKAKEIYNSIK